jgi:hypothetical protein
MFQQIDSAEESAMEALEDAAFMSLELGLAGDSPGRLVGVGENELLTWSNVECFHAESKQGLAIAAKLSSAKTQEELDALVAELWQLPLEWYDISEMGFLRDLWA